MFIAKQKQTQRHRKQSSCYQWGEGSGKGQDQDRRMGLNLTKFKIDKQDFPGDTVDKNLPANAGDTGSIPALERFLMPRSN